MARSKPSSRENGRLSQGPTTQAGKDRVKFNAVRHGLLAQRAVVLEGESQQEYDHVANAQYQRFQPQDEAEAEIVDEMASAKWRIRRLEIIETFLMNEAIRQSATGDPEADMAAAFQTLASNKTLALLLRYDSHLKLAYQRSMRNLIQMQRSVPIPAPEEASEENQPLPQSAEPGQPNEPIFMEALRRPPAPPPASPYTFAASSPSRPV